MKTAMIPAGPPRPPLFGLGRIFVSPGSFRSLPAREIGRALTRHAAGDWGDLKPLDRVANDLALEKGSPVLSSFTARNGKRFRIITTASRSETRVELREEE